MASHVLTEALLAKVLDQTKQRCSHICAAPGPHLCCPITHELLVDPVIALDGHTYERSAIERYFGLGSFRSPVTNARLPGRTLTPNWFAKAAVQEFKSEAVHTISDLLPVMVELGEFETAEKLLERAEEYAGDDTDSLGKLQCTVWCAVLSEAGREGRTDIVVDKLPRLCRINVKAAESAISSLSQQLLADILEDLSDDFDPLATVVVAHARLRGQMDKVVTQIRELDQPQLASVPVSTWKAIADALGIAGAKLAPNVDLPVEPEHAEEEVDIRGEEALIPLSAFDVDPFDFDFGALNEFAWEGPAIVAA